MIEKERATNDPGAKSPLFNDEKLFEFVFKSYFPRLMAFAVKFIADRTIAEDVIQDVFLKIWLKRKTIAEDTFSSYVFTSVRNACLNQVKHQQLVVNHQIEYREEFCGERLYYADFFNDPFHQTVFNEVRDEIERTLDELPAQTRRIFRFSRFGGLKNTEIAERLNISVRTVEKHNTRALQKLKANLVSYYCCLFILLEFVKNLKR